jgi:hypothetical protein
MSNVKRNNQGKRTKASYEEALSDVDVAWGVREEAIYAFIDAVKATEPRDDDQDGPCRICGEELQDLFDADAAWQKACEVLGRASAK